MSYGSGANPTDLTAGTTLYLHVTDGGVTVTESAPIRLEVGTAPVIAAQDWAAGSTNTTLNCRITTGARTYTYSFTGLPSGVTESATDGVLTVQPDAAASGTISVVATDEYGAFVAYSVAYTVSAGGIGAMAIGTTFEVA